MFESYGCGEATAAPRSWRRRLAVNEGALHVNASDSIERSSGNGPRAKTAVTDKSSGETARIENHETPAGNSGGPSFSLRLSNIRIAHKLFLIIGILASVTLGVSYMGVTSISRVSDDAEEIDIAGNAALLASRIGEHVVSINRAEFRVVANPSKDGIKRNQDRITADKSELTKALEALKEKADDTQKRMIGELETSLRAYDTELDVMMDTARKFGARVDNDEARNKIREAAVRSAEVSEVTERAVKALIDYSEKTAERVTEAAASTAKSTQTIMISVAAIGVLGGIIIGYLMAQFAISRPLAAAVGCLRELATGNLSTEIFGVGRRDEVGNIANAMAVFKDNMIETRRLQAEQSEAEKRQAEMERQREAEKQAAEAEKRAADERAKEERRKAMLDLADSFEAQVGRVVTDVSGAATQLQSTAGAMSATAEETSRQATAVAAAAEQASANVQTVASASEELSSSIEEIGRQVAQSSRIAQNAVEAAKTTDAKVQSLAEAANKIGEVVNLINDIASQTNLLALNATIEAARAGEAGKGFAVVATEVKSLATQTAKATEEIAGQIGAIQGSTTDAVQAIQGIGSTIAEISEIAAAIASAVEEQSAATREIAGNVQQAAAGTKDVTGNIGGVTQAASETGAATAQVLSAANTLVQHGDTLKREVDSFLKTVRAA